MSEAAIYIAAVAVAIAIIGWLWSAHRIARLEDAVIQLTIRNTCTYLAHQRLSEEHADLWARHVALAAWGTEFVQHYNRHIATCDSFDDEADWWKHGVSPEDFDK